MLVDRSKVTPKKSLEITRLKLTAAVLSVKMAYLIRKELNTKKTEVNGSIQTELKLRVKQVTYESK